MSQVIQFPPRLRAVSPDPEPDQPPAQVLVMGRRCVPVVWCDVCRLRLPADHTHFDEPTPA